MEYNNNSLPNCLLVDDLEENLIALKALLADQKLNIFTARYGNEALELMLKHEFALAIIDVQMPEMGGFELAEIMRSTEKTKHIPIIFVTAGASNTQRVFQGYEAGAVDFLHKPLAPQVVLAKVRIFIELYQNKIALEEKILELRETEKGLHDALKSRDEFMSICSHELKTPLTSLKMQLQVLERVRIKQGDKAAFESERMDKFLYQADKSVDRIIHLVNDMLDISRVATGRLSLNCEKTEIGEFVIEVIERVNPLLEMASCECKISVEKGIYANIDRFRIEQVLTNLLTNAAKYAPEKPVTVKVHLNGNNNVKVSVQDQGEGIGPSDQERIFERFERVNGQAGVSGLGLGLYISKEIVEMHHGSLEVQSSPGQGANFIFSLPLDKQS